MVQAEHILSGEIELVQQLLLEEVEVEERVQAEHILSDEIELVQQLLLEEEEVEERAMDGKLGEQVLAVTRFWTELDNKEKIQEELYKNINRQI